jgi:hypothetical protein
MNVTSEHSEAALVRPEEVVIRMQRSLSQPVRVLRPGQLKFGVRVSKSNVSSVFARKTMCDGAWLCHNDLYWEGQC